MSLNRDTAVDAVDVLNDLLADLVAGTNIFIEYRQRLKSGTFQLGQMVAVQKMCLSHLALAFCKLLEFWEHYQRVVPDIHRGDLKRLNTEIRKRGAKNFRNKVAGHIWDKKLQRPLRHSEIMAQLEGFIGKRADDFLCWVNNPNDNSYPNSIVSVVETIRDAIANEHAIQQSEIIER
jgi:hypothetical protein